MFTPVNNFDKINYEQNNYVSEIRGFTQNIGNIHFKIKNHLNPNNTENK